MRLVVPRGLSHGATFADDRQAEGHRWNWWPTNLATLDEKLKKIEHHEQRAILMEELHSLPEQYQMPLVLCYLEGRSRRAAAEELEHHPRSCEGPTHAGSATAAAPADSPGSEFVVRDGGDGVPVKSAAAAVTPNSIGLTVAGCGKWLAGGSAKERLTSTVTTSAKLLN